MKNPFLERMKELHGELLQDQVELSSNNSIKAFSQSNFDVTVGMLVKRTVIKKSSGNLTQLLCYNYCNSFSCLAPTWSSCHVNAIKE